MGNNLTYTITGCEPDGGKYEGMSLYTATADGTTFVLEAPIGLYTIGQTDTKILTDVRADKARGGKADYWLGTGLTF
ncbi:hypothetical protein GS896_25765 [Rhodococcus hoagii]|nr:hypothetical protein [Prescottella equi]MBM4654086.1 hypothetical protein [Prescottella equi]NKR23359.1 hypothetical protein [Prescottella equi]NKT56030.1 hypothetical protein [Prescottella equi]NKU37346.1 hypothetical protein [Prescottella equi]